MAAPTSRAGPPYGLPRREPIGPYLDRKLPATPPVPSGGWVAVKAFPYLTFQDPVFLTHVPGGRRLCVCGRQGIVETFDNDPNTTTKAVFLDLRARCQGWDDSGLLGLAFHPEFGRPGSPNRGYVYIAYNFTEHPSRGPGRPPTNTPTFNRLARFTVPDGADEADPNSELVLIDQRDENLWHNGGALFFHPDDGFLYLSLGDEGGDYGNTQRIDRDLFSGVLRIDVDCRGGSISHPPVRQPETGTTAHYFIPNDNPWCGVPGVLEEFWCIGFRSPHRMTIDPETRRIWLGDVGDGSREEIDLIEKAGNYQWRFREGTLNGPHARPARPIGQERPPIYEYPHSEGVAVIGGYVYRGREHARDLGGRYVFGDMNGRTWAMSYEPGGRPAVVPLCTLPSIPSPSYGTGLSSFGEDADGELYLCQMGDKGQIYKLARTSQTGTSLPRRLSQTGAFRDVKTLTPAPGLIPYEVNTPLWSDGAVKRRWIAVPNDGPPYSAGERIGFSTAGEWSFPAGTVFVKHFEFATDETQPQVRRRLETRILVREEGGAVYGVTYKWNAAQDDAELLDDGRTETITIRTAHGSRSQTWSYPSPRDCLMCHTPQASYVLGVKTRQLNGAFTDPGTGMTDNQLRAWNHLELFLPALAEAEIPGLPRLVPVGQADASLEQRVRSYLDANCAHCHRPGGVRARFDARFDTELTAQGLIDGEVANPLGAADARVVAPRDRARSILHRRLESLEPGIRMPPLARNVADPEALAALRSWIDALPASPRPPAIRLTSPADGGILAAGSEVALVAEAQGDAIARVEFFRGETKLAEGSARPFRATWKGAPVGSFLLTARATDARGRTVTSEGVIVTVVPPPEPLPPGGQEVSLTDLRWISVTNGWGPAEKDRSNGEQGAADGRRITLDGRSYARGLGVHAASEVRYPLGGGATTFLAEIGIDDEAGDGGSVVFQVWADGAKLFDSGVVTGRSPARTIRVDLTGKAELKLIVTDAGDGPALDHADWAGARLVRAGGKPAP